MRAFIIFWFAKIVGLQVGWLNEDEVYCYMSLGWNFPSLFTVCGCSPCDTLFWIIFLMIKILFATVCHNGLHIMDCTHTTLRTLPQKFQIACVDWFLCSIQWEAQLLVSQYSTHMPWNEMTMMMLELAINERNWHLCILFVHMFKVDSWNRLLK